MRREIQIEQWDKTFPATLSSNFINVMRRALGWCQEYSFFVAGGAARSLVTGEVTTDIDLYPHVNHGNLEGYLHSQGYERKSRRGVPTFFVEGVEIQLIYFSGATPYNVLDGFDLTCCQMATNGEWFIQYADAEDHASDKIISFTDHAINEPANVENRFWRVQKYLKKGYKLGKGQGDRFFEMEWAPEFKDRQAERILAQSSGVDRMEVPAPSGWVSGPLTTGEVNNVSSSRRGRSRRIEPTVHDEAVVRYDPASGWSRFMPQETVAPGYALTNDTPETVAFGYALTNALIEEQSSQTVSEPSIPLEWMRPEYYNNLDYVQAMEAIRQYNETDVRNSERQEQRTIRPINPTPMEDDWDSHPF